MNKKKYILVIVIILILIEFLFNTYDTFESIKYVNRRTNKIKVEKVAGEKWLKFLYYSPYGKLTLNSLVKKKFFQEYYGKRMDSIKSKKNIRKFVKNHNINLENDLLSLEEYKNFNEFFYRKLKKDARKIDDNKNILVSPADSKLLVYQNIKENDKFLVKGIEFDLEKFLNDKKLAGEYKNATILIFRLAPTDYHRFHFPIDSYVGNNKKINGSYYSVSPLALRKNPYIFMENKREYTILKSEIFSDVIMAEVGATMVGSIIQTYKENTYVKKGLEKGYFKFGGSTVVLIFKSGLVDIDKDILDNSSNNLETKVLMGEKIGQKY